MTCEYGLNYYEGLFYSTKKLMAPASRQAQEIRCELRINALIRTE